MTDESTTALPPIPAKAPHPFWAFFGRPIPIAIAWLVGVAGFGSSIYFYLVPAQYRELSYLVEPTPTVIVKSGELSTMTVAIGGQQIKTDLTASVVAFWNAGSEAIRPAHVLTPLTLRTNPIVPIVDVTLRKTSRDVVRPTLDKTNMSRGEVAVSWNILEQKDQFVLQVVFAGGQDTKLEASATLEGQREIKKLELKSARSAVVEMNQASKAIFVTYVFLMVLTALVVVLRLRRRRRARDLFWIVYLLLQIGFLIYLANRTFFGPRPPLGF